MKLFSDFREWRRAERGLLFLLLISLVFKINVLLSQEVINVDGVRYIDAARHFAQGNFLEGLRIDWMPFYALLIAAFHFFVRDWVLAGQLISLFSLVFALVPLYLLTKDLFDEKVAFWTGLAFVLSPVLNNHAVGLLRDPIFLFFVAWSVYFFLHALQTERIRFFTLAALSSTFALCCRLEGILLWAVFLSVLPVLAIKNRSERRFLLNGTFALVCLPLALGVLAAGVLLVSGPDLVSFGRTGELAGSIKEMATVNSFTYYKSMFSAGVLDNYHSRYEFLKELARSSRHLNRTGSVLETTRHYLPVIYLIAAVEAAARNLFPLFVLPLLVAFGKRTYWRRSHWLPLLLTGTYFLMAYYFLFTRDFISKRYILVPAFLLLPWVGLGLERIRIRIAGFRRPQIAMILFLLVFFGVPAFKSVRDITRPGKGRVLRVAGKWLAMQPDLQNSIIACSDPRIRFYSSLEKRYFKQVGSPSVSSDFRKMENIAFSQKAALLVIEISKNKRHMMPGFRYFSLLKEFSGVKNDVLIYSRNEKGPASG